MFLFPKANPQGFASGLEAHVGDHEVGDQREQPGARWRRHQVSLQIFFAFPNRYNSKGAF